jgi:hypothetical protein
MAFDVPLQVMGLSAGYAAVLGWLERKFPSIKPDHIWVEVAGGVLVTLLPVTIAAHRKHHHEDTEGNEPMHWQTYEGTVWRAFFSSAIPVVLWQLGEAVVRRTELLSYSSDDDETGDIDSIPELPAPSDADDTDEAEEQEQPHTAPIATEAIRHIKNAQSSTARAHRQVQHNPGLAMRLATEANQAAASALTSMLRIQGLIAAASPDVGEERKQRSSGA